MVAGMTQKRARILVTDDEQFNRLLLARILEKDYDVDFAENGQQALNKLAQHEYDALLLDVMMPVLNGIDTLKIIRENADLMTLPVIMVSALSDSETIAEGLELGANDYIPKPIDPRIVSARIKTQITIKHLMDERKTVINALEEANQMRQRMMQIASHDLKNPLNNLSLLFSVLRTSMDANSPQLPDFMKMATQSIETMDTIINDFLSGEVFFAEDISPDIAPQFATDMLYTILGQYSVTAEKKGIEIIVEQLDNALILADVNRITQVISNLVSNAIKYSPCHGKVYIRAYQTDNIWRMEIQDTGAGIPQEEQQYLFQAFSKHNISTKPTDGENSTGLGLWIAAEMMRVQNGTIGMDSPDEGGCCFWIEIPLAEQSFSVSA